MGYLILRCSSLNLIQGLRLDPSQLRGLFEIARVVDALSPPPPVSFIRETDLTPLVDAFRRLANALFRRKRIPDLFGQDLIRIRETQSRLLRGGLRYDRSVPPGSCRRCHWTPGARFLAWPWIDQIASHPIVRQERALSHLVGPFGLVSFLYVCWKSAAVDAILNPIQSAAVASFSGCLLPPRFFPNPIRVGHADLVEWEIPALKRLRSALLLLLPGSAEVYSDLLIHPAGP